MAELEFTARPQGTVDRVNHLPTGVEAWQQSVTFSATLPSGALVSAQISATMNDAMPFEGDLYSHAEDYLITISKVES